MPLWQPYLDLLRGHNYRDRPHQALLEHWRRWGIGAEVSSQDGAKSACCHLLGRLKLSTVAVLGRNIGEYGLHFTPEEFRAAGYHLTEVFPAEAALDGLALPDELGMAALLAADHAHAVAPPRVPLALHRTWPAQPLPLDATAVVTLLYRTLLGREPDEGGLTAHVSMLDQGVCDLPQMVRGFLDSREFREMLGSAGLSPPQA